MSLLSFPFVCFKLRLRQLHGDHRDQPFANIVAGNRDFVLLLLEHSRGRSEIVDRARQRRTKSGKMRAAIDGVDRVGKCKNVFRVAVVILQRDFDFDGVFFPFQ